jgi:hypothetical protein
MAFIILKTAEEVTEKATVPYVKEKIGESGITTTIVTWLPWTGVVLNSAGLYRDISRGLTYSGGVSWLVKRVMFWFLPNNYYPIISARCIGLRPRYLHLDRSLYRFC